MLDESHSAFFPSWLVRLDSPPSSRDPLGLQAHAMGQADELLPGLNVFTSRARYYGFLCWSILRAQAGAPPRAHLDRVLRLERLLVLCEAIRHEDNPYTCSYVGRRRGRRFVSERGGAALWELPTRILKSQASNGAFRLYRTSLADLGLVEEDGLEEGLGLRLTHRGQRLGEQFQKGVDDGVVSWALDPATDQRKRRDSLWEAARGMCLSARIGAHERRQLVDALFGTDGHGIERRETTAVLFEHDLILPASVGEDIASADVDLVAEEDGRPAEQAADTETRGNWGVLRRALELPPSNRLRGIQVAGGYQLAALGMNGLLRSALDPAEQVGRMSVADWRSRIGGRAGDGFETVSASAWAGHRAAATVADQLLHSEGSTWQEIGALAVELLLRVTLDDRYLRWLSEQPTPILERLVLWSRDAGTTSAGAMAARLLPELIEHHAEVSARKGKGRWLEIDGGEVVRGDPRPLRLMLHSLRFAQLQQLAADLKLRPEDIADET